MNKRDRLEIVGAQVNGLRRMMAEKEAGLLHAFIEECSLAGMPSHLMALAGQRVATDSKCVQEATLAIYRCQETGQKAPEWLELLVPKDFERRMKKIMRESAGRKP